MFQALDGMADVFRRGRNLKKHNIFLGSLFFLSIVISAFDISICIYNKGNEFDIEYNEYILFILSMLFGWIFINVVARVVGTIKNMWRNDRGIAGRESADSLSLELSCAVISQLLSTRGKAEFRHNAMGQFGYRSEEKTSDFKS